MLIAKANFQFLFNLEQMNSFYFVWMFLAYISVSHKKWNTGKCELISDFRYVQLKRNAIMKVKLIECQFIIRIGIK